MDKQLLKLTFRNTALAAVYIFLVSQIMQHGDEWFGKEDKFLTPFVVLLLFSLSASVVGGLMMGQAIILVIEGKRTEGIRAAVYSVGWLALYTLLGVLALAALK
jgi:hypothetical protein